MKSKIVLFENGLIISFNIKPLLKNLQLNIRFESEEFVNEIIKKKNPELVITDIDLNDIEEKLSDIINNKAFLAQLEKKQFINENKYGLTKREIEILALVVEGLTKQEIANKISLSFHTVDSHLRNIYKKLKIKSRSQAITKAINEKLI